MGETVIKVEGLTKRYGDIVAVDTIDFEVKTGATAALLGANGAGKTTTLAMLLGLLLPTAGAITVLVDLPRRLTVVENLTVYARLYGLAKVSRRVRRVCEELAIAPLMARPLGNLSAGQRLRVALAKALLNEPEILLLDEPTASLDPDTADWVRGYLLDYQKRTGATILLASHNMVEVERMCTDVLIMRQGAIEERGTPAEVIARHGRETLEEVFLDIARGADGGARAASRVAQ